jgi:hypothetical protein
MPFLKAKQQYAKVLVVPGKPPDFVCHMTRSIGLEFDEWCQKRGPNETLAGLLLRGVVFQIEDSGRTNRCPLLNMSRKSAKTDRSSYICEGPRMAPRALA